MARDALIMWIEMSSDLTGQVEVWCSSLYISTAGGLQACCTICGRQVVRHRHAQLAASSEELLTGRADSCPVKPRTRHYRCFTYCSDTVEHPGGGGPLHMPQRRPREIRTLLLPATLPRTKPTEVTRSCDDSSLAGAPACRLAS